MSAGVLAMTAALALVPHYSRRALTGATAAAAASSLLTPTTPAAFAAAGVPVFGSGSIADGLRGKQEDFEALYERNPADLSGLSLPPGCSGAAVTDICLIFHGSGGPDRETASVMSALQRQNKESGLTRAVAVVNWMPWFTFDTNRLSFVSRDIGQKLGKALATEAPNLRSLHIVGTSAGSFASDACCSAYVEARADKASRASVRLSLADPFAAKLSDDKNSGRGAQFFGRSADFAEHILNRDDPVPNTEVPLSYCYVYDVTAAKERKTFPDPVKSGDGVQDFILQSLKYHNWPMEWYARHSETLIDDKGLVRLPSHDDLPRGTVVKVA